jgi:hypothetical protein
MNDEIKKTFDRQHLLGTIFICIAVLMVIQGLYLQWKNDQESNCQADYNSKVTTVIAQRGEWADEDRAALNTMIFKVIDPQADEQDRADAVQLYAVTAKKNDANRQANPLPDRTSCG